jgi:hypothetical protein
MKGGGWNVYGEQRFYGYLIVALASFDGLLVTNLLFFNPHLLGALLEPSLPSRVERVETLNTPLWGGLVDNTYYAMLVAV